MICRWFVCAAVLVSTSWTIAARESNAASNSENVSIRWKSLLVQAFEFIAIEHAFRVGTQPETRATMDGPFFQGYARSIDNLHGWADGDPFLVNYVGHPMQGAVSGFIFVQNDLRYEKAEFGKNKAYWKSRLRATAFAWAYSEQFEIGPISEATIGQAYYPQQGFVDHVITPTIGLAWMITEDSLDRYVISRLESHTANPWIKMFARAGINPSRSMANMLRGEVPWHRDTRPGIFSKDVISPSLTAVANSDSIAHNIEAVPAKSNESNEPWIERDPIFQVGMQYDFFEFSGRQTAQACNGGNVTLGYTVNSRIQLVADVGGCKMITSEPNVSGDATVYLAGPKFELPRFGRWQPYIQVLAGGNKITAETVYPNLKPPQSIIEELQPYQTHSLYTNAEQSNSWAMQFGGGLEYAMTSALAFKALDVEELYTWSRPLEGRDYNNALRVSTGLMLRFGTW